MRGGLGEAERKEGRVGEVEGEKGREGVSVRE